MNEALKKVKDRFVVLFVLAIVARAAAGVSMNFEPGAAPDPAAAVVNLLAFALALGFLWHVFKLSRGLGLGALGTFLAILGSLLPLLNLVVVIVLLAKYKKVQNVRLNFLMQDVPA